ncbi:GlcNAc-transferase family protein [Insolitispirillum peregrinum]|uniref:GlcNAc-transferase family protein n=1 Tax=Insolitispirillum peregrinum TaxID=80876 RepID=UPI00361A8B9B
MIPSPLAASADRPTIFVAIASYRDPDLAATMSDLFAKADAPDRLRVGVCLQWVPEDDTDCAPWPDRPAQVRVLEVHARDSQGACWARSRTQELMAGEDYYFQIDSHMRFVPGWDSLLLAMLAAAPSPRAVLSTYPLSFEPPSTFSPPRYVRIHPKGFDTDGILLQRSTGASIEDAPKVLEPTCHLGAGLLFAAAAMVRDVPYDPYLYFQGEEISLAVRLWSHGWDLFTPNQAVAYHDYTPRPSRPRHWEDQKDWAVLRQRAAKRVRHMLGMEQYPASAEDPALRDIDRYGLGRVRSLASYEAASGIDFRVRLIDGKPGLLPDREPEQPTESQKRQKVFSAIWAGNGWRCEETRSGSGSTMAATATLRPRLRDALRFLNVQVLADAGCGDGNWIADLLPDLRLYLGFDIAPEAVSHLMQRFADQTAVFARQADIVSTVLPRCDAILCRDVLTHLPVEAALAALRAFQRSGSRYLIATHHTTERNQWVTTGGWYPTDLCAAPFSLPEPTLLLPEGLTGSSKALGVWPLQELAPLKP